MQQPIGAPYPVSDFLQWQAGNQLELVPKFQRRDVWSPKAKSYLIDTILRLLPIPPVYLRLSIDPKRQQVVRQVVDGQQRLKTVIAFVRGEFAILKVHNEEFGGKLFGQLPEEIQRRILGYKFFVYTLENVTDPEILSIFARLNTYVEKLNSQELINAEFFGVFKQTTYQIAHNYNAFWVGNRILSDKAVARMGDAKLVSEIVISMLDGLRQTKTKDLREYYRRCDDRFPEKERITKQFSEVMNIIGALSEGEIALKKTPFRRVPLFYSLFLAIYDARFSLPGSRRQRLPFTAARIRAMSNRLSTLADHMRAQTPPKWVEPFIDASGRGTADVGKRKLRHTFIWDHVILDT